MKTFYMRSQGKENNCNSTELKLIQILDFELWEYRDYKEMHMNARTK